MRIGMGLPGPFFVSFRFRPIRGMTGFIGGLFQLFWGLLVFSYYAMISVVLLAILLYRLVNVTVRFIRALRAARAARETRVDNPATKPSTPASGAASAAEHPAAEPATSPATSSAPRHSAAVPITAAGPRDWRPTERSGDRPLL